MSWSKFSYLCCLVFWLYLTLVVAQQDSLWDENLALICGNITNVTCMDLHMGQLFGNLTRLYNPDLGYSNISYLGHHLYEASAPHDFQTIPAILDNILKLSNQNYSQTEVNIIEAFPRKFHN